MANSVSSQPFLAFTGDAADLGTLKKFAATHGWPDSCITQGDIRTAAAFLKDNPSPPLLLVEIPQASEAQAQLNALAEVCAPETKVIVVGTVNEFSFYNWLMEIGISGYLLKPLSDAALEGAYAKAMAPPVQHVASTKKPGKVVAVMGVRGGVGSTALAINLAGVIAENGKLSTALVDLDPQDGSIALMLDMEPSKGFREALEKPDRIDPLFIDRVMQKHGKYLSLLSSEETLQERVAAHESAADILLAELRDKFQVIVLDLPRHLNSFARKVLAKTDEVVLVSELTLPSVRDTLRLADLTRELMKKTPAIVVNRVGLGKHGVAPADFEKGVNAKINYSIPFAPDIYMQVGSDIPAVKSKSHAAIKPIYDLAAKLFPEAKIAAAKPEKTSGGLFKFGSKGKKEEAPKAAEKK